MRNWKRIISLLLSICISLWILPGLAVTADASQEDYRWITDRAEVDGSDFTGSAILAAALNSIFDGNANVYYDADFTKMVNTELGSSRVPNNGVNKYVGPYGDNEDNVDKPKKLKKLQRQAGLRAFRQSLKKLFGRTKNQLSDRLLQ